MNYVPRLIAVALTVSFVACMPAADEPSPPDIEIALDQEAAAASGTQRRALSGVPWRCSAARKSEASA